MCRNDRAGSRGIRNLPSAWGCRGATQFIAHVMGFQNPLTDKTVILNTNVSRGLTVLTGAYHYFWFNKAISEPP